MRRLSLLLPALRLACLVGLCGALSAQAGLSLQESLELQRDAVRDPPALAPLGPLDSAAGLHLAVSGRSRAVLPALLGREIDGGTGVHWVGAAIVASEGVWRFRPGLAWRDGRTLGAGSFEGSSIARHFAAGEFYASVQRRHWGPSWTGSLILDAAAPALPAVGWRTPEASTSDSRWLAWLGPWNADLFLARLSQQQPRGVRLAGLRLQAMPWPGLELGASRSIQWGGEGRPRSLRTLFDALIGRDNLGDSGIADANEPGNQLAGVDARYGIALGQGRRLRVYGQAIGEDEAGYLPSKWMRSAGLDLLWPRDGGSVLVFAEGVDTQAGPSPGTAYTHHLYPEGYSQRGRPLGHPAGGDRRLTSAGVQLDQGRLAASVRVHRGHTLDATRASLRGTDLAASWQLTPAATLGASWVRWREGQDEQRAGQLWWRLAM